MLGKKFCLRGVGVYYRLPYNGSFQGGRVGGGVQLHHHLHPTPLDPRIIYILFYSLRKAFITFKDILINTFSLPPSRLSLTHQTRYPLQTTPVVVVRFLSP